MKNGVFSFRGTARELHALSHEMGWYTRPGVAYKPAGVLSLALAAACLGVALYALSFV